MEWGRLLLCERPSRAAPREALGATTQSRGGSLRTEGPPSPPAAFYGGHHDAVGVQGAGGAGSAGWPPRWGFGGLPGE